MTTLTFSRRAALICLIAVLAAGALRAEPTEAAGQRERTVLPEYEVKAGFLFNFAKFVEWPADAFASADAPLILCLIGDDPFGSTLDTLVKGKAINGHAVLVRRLRRAEDAVGCHVLFIPDSESNRLGDILLAVKSRSVLTVGEVAEFPARGGAIRLFVADSKVRFDVNVGATNAVGLKLSSRLLALAASVRDDRRR
jgi:hypothetical protein